jgi:hypothetical protein
MWRFDSQAHERGPRRARQHSREVLDRQRHHSAASCSISGGVGGCPYLTEIPSEGFETPLRTRHSAGPLTIEERHVFWRRRVRRPRRTSGAGQAPGYACPAEGQLRLLPARRGPHRGLPYAGLVAQCGDSSLREATEPASLGRRLRRTALHADASAWAGRTHSSGRNARSVGNRATAVIIVWRSFSSADAFLP